MMGSMASFCSRCFCSSLVISCFCGVRVEPLRPGSFLVDAGAASGLLGCFLPRDDLGLGRRRCLLRDAGLGGVRWLVRLRAPLLLERVRGAVLDRLEGGDGAEGDVGSCTPTERKNATKRFVGRRQRNWVLARLRVVQFYLAEEKLHALCSTQVGKNKDGSHARSCTSRFSQCTPQSTRGSCAYRSTPVSQ